MKPLKITSISQLEEAADQLNIQSLALAKIKANQNVELTNLKTRHKADIAERNSDIKSLTGKVKRWVEKNAVKIFGEKAVGTIKTKISIISLRQNPKKIVSIDDLTEVQKMELLRKNGHADCIVIKEVISVEALERLTLEQLHRNGYDWKQSQTIKVEPNLQKEDVA